MCAYFSCCFSLPTHMGNYRAIQWASLPHPASLRDRPSMSTFVVHPPLFCDVKCSLMMFSTPHVYLFPKKRFCPQSAVYFKNWSPQALCEIYTKYSLWESFFTRVWSLLHWEPFLDIVSWELVFEYCQRCNSYSPPLPPPPHFFLQILRWRNIFSLPF
jgi:hypothetical protein